MKNRNIYICAFLLLIGISCSNEDIDPVLRMPTVKNIEIGYGNQKTAVIGEDFHFNADVIAGERIEDILLRIQQREEEDYSEPWEFELVWGQYAGLKNTNIHEHFVLPENAPPGKYDFVFTVSDTNGEVLVIREDFEIVDKE